MDDVNTDQIVEEMAVHHVSWMRISCTPQLTTEDVENGSVGWRSAAGHQAERADSMLPRTKCCAHQRK